MPKIEEPTPRALRAAIANCAWSDESTLTVVAGRSSFKVTAAELKDFAYNSYGPNSPGGIVLHLDEVKFTELVKAHAKAILANLVQ